MVQLVFWYGLASEGYRAASQFQHQPINNNNSNTTSCMFLYLCTTASWTIEGINSFTLLMPWGYIMCCNDVFGYWGMLCKTPVLFWANVMVPSFTQGDWCCAKLPKIVHDQNKQFPVAVSKELWKGKERSWRRQAPDKIGPRHPEWPTTKFARLNYAQAKHK